MNNYTFLDVLVTIGGRGADGNDRNADAVLLNNINTKTELNCSIANLPYRNHGHSALYASMGIISCGGILKECLDLNL